MNDSTPDDDDDDDEPEPRSDAPQSPDEAPADDEIEDPFERDGIRYSVIAAAQTRGGGWLFERAVSHLVVFVLYGGRRPKHP